MLALSLKFPKT